MNIIVIGSEIYYRRTFSKDLQQNMHFFEHIGFRPHDQDKCDIHTILHEIAEFQNNLNLKKCIILGHSIHAFIAAEYAKQYSSKVSKVILVGSGPYIDYSSANEYFEKVACDKRKALLRHNMSLPNSFFSNNMFIDRMLRFGPMLWYDYQYDAKSLWKDIELNETAANIIWGSMFENYRIQAIQQPRLIIVGKYDFFNPFYLWKDKNVMIFEKSGHTPQLEESQRFQNVITNYSSRYV